mgnify:CR=1 FL=1
MVNVLPPTESQYGFVTAKVIRRVADSANDVDDFPDAVAAVGTITFKPRLQAKHSIEPSVYEIRDSVVGRLNDQGSLVSSGNPSSNGLWLLVGVYDVVFNLQRGSIPSFLIEVKVTNTIENPLDLAKEVPYVPPVGAKPNVVLIPSTIQADNVLVKGSDGEIYGVPLSNVGGGGGSVPDATTQLKGKIKLAGDLSGTADLPTVPALVELTTKLLNKTDIGHSHDVSDLQDVTELGSELLHANTQEDLSTLIGIRSYDTLIPFSTLPGDTDDDKLENGATLINTPTLKGRTILLDENRDYVFTRQLTIKSGFSLMGCFRPQDQNRVSRPLANRVVINLNEAFHNQGWLRIGAGSTFGVSLTNLSIVGNINSSVFHGSEEIGGVLWTSTFRDISVQGAKSVFGTKDNKLLITACTIDGYWNVNDVRETAFHVGGSDSWFAPSIFLLDSPPEQLGRDEYLATVSFLGKTWIRDVYCTANGHSGLFIDGGASANDLTFESCVFEGMNINRSSPGALIRMRGGQVRLRNLRLAYAMGAPELKTVRDKGVIHLQRGALYVSECTYELGNTITSWDDPAQAPIVGGLVSESVPLVYVEEGAKLRIRDIVPLKTWTGKPVVKQEVAGSIDADDSVTVVTTIRIDVPNGDGDTNNFSSPTGTSVTLDRPDNIVNGDFLIAGLQARNSESMVPYTSIPSGWTVIEPSNAIVSGGIVRLYIKKVMDAESEPPTYTWSGGSSGRNVGIITRLTGVADDFLMYSGPTSAEFGDPIRLSFGSTTTDTPGSLAVSLGGFTCSLEAEDPKFVIGSEGTDSDKGIIIDNVVTTASTSKSGLTMMVNKLSPAALVPLGRMFFEPGSSLSAARGYTVVLRSQG